MFTRILSPLSAEPNWHCPGVYPADARWPGSRSCIRSSLSIGPPAGSPRRVLPQNNAVAYSELLNRSWAHAQLELTRNLGQGLYLDSILMGGHRRRALDMTLDSARQAEIAAHMPGGLLDINA